MGQRPVCYDAKRVLLILGAALECGFVAMLLSRPGPGNTFAYLVLFLAAFACYALAVRIVLRAIPNAGAGPPARGSDRHGGPAVAGVLALACLFRVTFLFAAPALSDDLYRYLWDGRVTLSGGNPYLGAPFAPAGTAPQSADLARIGHAEVPTIYPPAAQVFFAAGAALGPGVYGIKVLVVLADLLVMAVLLALLRERGRPAIRVLVYAWNPLAVTETAWSGHVEPVAVLCVLLAAVAIIQKREARAALSLALGGLVKLFPLVLFAPLLRSMRARFLPLALLLLLAACWPFRAAGRHLFDGLREYASRWLGNESLFGVAHAAIAWIGPAPHLKAAIAFVRQRVPHTGPLDLLYGYVHPIDLAKGVCALAALGFAVRLWRRRVEPLRGLYLMTGAVLLLSPTAHPWYFLWILPWLCLFPSLPWILLSGLVALAYANLGASGRAGEPYPWIRAVEYAPFYGLLFWEWLRAGAGSRFRSGMGRRPAGPSTRPPDPR